LSGPRFSEADRIYTRAGTRPGRISTGKGENQSIVTGLSRFHKLSLSSKVDAWGQSDGEGDLKVGRATVLGLERGENPKGFRVQVSAFRGQGSGFHTRLPSHPE